MKGVVGILIALLVIIGLLNLFATRPLATGQPFQRFVWLPLIFSLTMISILIAGPLLLFPTGLLTQVVSFGFTTWYLMATAYLWTTFYLTVFSVPPKSADYIIILGAKVTASGPSRTLNRRLLTGVHFADQLPAVPKFVLSGGQGPDEPQTEAAAMAAFLLKEGIPESNLLLETQSTSTDTNFQYSQKIIENDWHENTAPVILVVTSDYHLVRSRLLARKHHLKVKSLGALTTTSALFQAMLREIAALLIQFRYPLFFLWILGIMAVRLVFY